MNSTGNNEMNHEAAPDHTSFVLILKNLATWALIGLGSITAEKLAVYLGIVATLLTIFSIARREFFTNRKG